MGAAIELPRRGFEQRLARSGVGISAPKCKKMKTLLIGLTITIIMALLFLRPRHDLHNLPRVALAVLERVDAHARQLRARHAAHSARAADKGRGALDGRPAAVVAELNKALDITCAICRERVLACSQPGGERARYRCPIIVTSNTSTCHHTAHTPSSPQSRCP